jgi:16S rRNA (cytosine967-C5)-methyltransferase
MRFQSYFNTAVRIIELYNGAIPLSHFLKQYFSENKKHGSKDRKFITHACYNYYRIGHALKNLDVQERLKISIFLCNEKTEDWKILYDDKWLLNWNEILNERIAFIKAQYESFNIDEIFPFTDVLSSGIDATAFIHSHLIQPNVFLRTRNNHHDEVIRKLQQQGIFFNEIEENCIAVSNTTKIDGIININDEAVIQDYSSQQIKKFLKTVQSEIPNLKPEIKTWDCCAGSGGKSILAYDMLPKINLTVSDIRPSIINNFKKRFEKANIKNYKSFVADITKPAAKALPLGGEGFDLIICDAPCTGSGTWCRTPEQLYFFQSKKIEHYTTLQKKIVSNAIPHLKQGSYFLYITCSVFAAENEDIVELIQKEFQLTLIKSELLKGYDKKADTMFAALFKK